MGCGVTELVRVEALDASVRGAAAQRLAEAVVPEAGAAGPEPEGRLVGCWVLLAEVQVVADSPSGGGADWDDSCSAALAEADGDPAGG